MPATSRQDVPPAPPDLVRHQWITSSLGPRGPVGTRPVATGPRSSELVRVRYINILFMNTSRHSNRRGDPLRLIGRGDALLPDRPPLQQRPHHPHQVVRRRHQGDLLPLRIVAPHPLEVRPHRRRPPHRLPGRLGDQLADDRRPLARDVPQPIPVARLVLARDQPEVPARPPWHPRKRCGSSTKAATASAVRTPTPGMVRSRSDGGRVLRLLIQLLLDPPHLARQRLDLLEQQVPPQLLRRRRQLQPTEPLQALLRPQRRAAPGARRRRIAAACGASSWPASAWRSPGRGR